MNLASTKVTFFKNARRLLLELVIVFLGVFFAFQLNNYKDELASQRTKKNYYRLILRDFEVLAKEMKGYRSQIAQHLEKFEQDISGDSNPKVIPLKTLDMTTNMMILRSAFSSGYLENLDPGYVSNLSHGSNLLTRVAKLLDEYNFSITQALNHYQYDSNRFFTPEGKLLPEYSWIIDDLKYIDHYLERLGQAVEQGAVPDTRRLIGD
jgi:hypothetical protein